MQGAYPRPMPLNSARHQLRRANLAQLIDRAGGPLKTATALGKPNLRGHLSNIRDGKRGLGDALAAQLERAFHLPRGWMDAQHLHAGESTPTYGAKPFVDALIGSNDLPYLHWESIVARQEVPTIFRTALPDDALAPDHPAGTELVWSTRRHPAPGRVILVKDRHQQLHARMCHQGREPGHWLAAPINPAYVTFDSATDGVAVVATFKGRLEPDD